MRNVDIPDIDIAILDDGPYEGEVYYRDNLYRVAVRVAGQRITEISVLANEGDEHDVAALDDQDCISSPPIRHSRDRRLSTEIPISRHLGATRRFPGTLRRLGICAGCFVIAVVRIAYQGQTRDVDPRHQDPETGSLAVIRNSSSVMPPFAC